jgi:hypothetical protein
LFSPLWPTERPELEAVFLAKRAGLHEFLGLAFVVLAGGFFVFPRLFGPKEEQESPISGGFPFWGAPRQNREE